VVPPGAPGRAEASRLPLSRYPKGGCLLLQGKIPAPTDSSMIVRVHVLACVVS
jgi:hypothetical protein